MKKKIIFSAALTIFILIFISSCKNDYQPLETPQPVLLFSSDSLGLASSDIGIIELADSITYDITDSTAKKVEIRYKLFSNGASDFNDADQHDIIYYGVFLSKPGVSFFADYEYVTVPRNIDTVRTIDITGYPGLTLKFKVAITRKIDNTYRYVYFKNMELYKNP
jgi:hypothetical protein